MRQHHDLQLYGHQREYRPATRPRFMAPNLPRQKTNMVKGFLRHGTCVLSVCLSWVQVDMTCLPSCSQLYCFTLRTDCSPPAIIFCSSSLPSTSAVPQFPLWGLLKFHFIISSDLKCSAFVQPSHLRIIYSQPSIQPYTFRAQLHKGTQCHAGGFGLKWNLNILYGVLIIYKRAFYCAVFLFFFIPGQQNGKETCRSFHSRPLLKTFHNTFRPEYE